MNANRINYKIGFARGLSGAELPFAAVVYNPVLDAGFRMGRHVMFIRSQSTTDELARFITPAKNSGNIVHRSQVESPVKKVWAIAESEYAQLQVGQKLSRKSVIDTCVNAGIATHTARTQYQRWYSSKFPK